MTGLLDLVHGDLSGPFTLATPGGWRFFLLLVDDKSMYMWAALFSAKSDTMAAVKKFQERCKLKPAAALESYALIMGVSSRVLNFKNSAQNRESQQSVPHTPNRIGCF